MEHFTLYLHNTTKLWYTFGIYQQYPMSPALGSLTWQSCGVPAGYDGSSVGRVTWDMTLGVAIATYSKATRKFSVYHKIKAELGKCYQVISDSGIEGIDLTPTDMPCDPEQIKLANNTQKALHLGFTLSGKLFRVNCNVQGGEIVSYMVSPTAIRTFYVDAFREVDIDVLLSSVLIVEPVKLKFENNNNIAKIKVIEDAGTIKLTDPVYSVYDSGSIQSSMQKDPLSTFERLSENRSVKTAVNQHIDDDIDYYMD